MPRMWIPLLSSSTHRRISSGLYFVRAACRTMVRDCSEGGAGRGVGRGAGASDLLGGIGVAFAPVAGGFLGGGRVERLVAFGPVVGCLPLSFLVGVFSLASGCVVQVAASA